MTETVMMAAVGLILLRGVMTRTDVYEAFCRGAKRGMQSAVQLLPALCAMIMMIRLLNASGLPGVILRIMKPVTDRLGVPDAVAPLMLMRPLTGSGSLAAMQQIFADCGVDSRAGRLASALMCSSETIFYTMTVYAGAAGVKKLPGAVAASLIGYGAGLAVCLWLTR